tara:strand:- start:823 stop:1140 length:318 start_codon:yes stop_codon:yes gene_type:complete
MENKQREERQRRVAILNELELPKCVDFFRIPKPTSEEKENPTIMRKTKLKQFIQLHVIGLLMSYLQKMRGMKKHQSFTECMGEWTEFLLYLNMDISKTAYDPAFC